SGISRAHGNQRPHVHRAARRQRDADPLLGKGEETMMLKLENLYAWVVSATDEEQAWIDGFLSFEEGSGFYKDKRGQTKHRAPRVQKLYDILSHRFPAGLTATVKREGEKKGFKVDVVDNRVKPCVPDQTADLSWLDDRPFQHECVSAFQRRTRGIAW